MGNLCSPRPAEVCAEPETPTLPTEDRKAKLIAAWLAPEIGASCGTVSDITKDQATLALYMQLVDASEQARLRFLRCMQGLNEQDDFERQLMHVGHWLRNMLLIKVDLRFSSEQRGYAIRNVIFEARFLDATILRLMQAKKLGEF